jgi:rhomboid family GlyGly-CTERM serine protease
MIIVGIAAVLALTGESGREWLRYDRVAIADGESWRLLSGHFVHLGASHLLLNVAGLLLIWYLVGTAFSLIHWLLILAGTIAGVDLGFWFFSPGLTWYVGLSGLLHGLFAAGILATLSSQTKEASVLGALLLGKLVYEQFVGPLPGSEGPTGGTVIVDAHLYGAISAAVLASAVLIRVRTSAPL